MDTFDTCPHCHSQVRDTDYFCFNCGKSLQPKPLSVSVSRQIMLYLGSIVFAPMGFIWGVQYLRQPTTKARLIGITAIILTTISLIVASKLVSAYLTYLNEQMSMTIGSW